MACYRIPWPSWRRGSPFQGPLTLARDGVQRYGRTHASAKSAPAMVALPSTWQECVGRSPYFPGSGGERLLVLLRGEGLYYSGFHQHGPLARIATSAGAGCRMSSSALIGMKVL